MAINQQTPPNYDRPFSDDDLTLSVQSRTWADAVTLSVPIIGTGSPEGVVVAPQRQSYLDESGADNTTSYIKRVNDIAGDKSMGWVLG